MGAGRQSRRKTKTVRYRYEIRVEVEVESNEDDEDMGLSETGALLRSLIIQSLDQPAVREVEADVMEEEEI